MSIEYTPFLGVGLLLGSYNKVIGFLEHYQLLGALDPSKDDLEYIAQCLGVDIQYFGSDDVYFVGWKTSSDDISHLGLLLEGTKRRWVAKFSKHVPELVHLVDSYQKKRGVMTITEEHELFEAIKEINKLCKEFGYYIEENSYSSYLTGGCGEIFRAARLKEIQGFLHGVKYWKSL